MVTLIEIDKDVLRPCVVSAFDGDAELLSRYHIIQGTLNECVSDTLDRIEQVSKTNKLKYFSVTMESAVIGFTVIGDAFLLSFGIKERYRVRAVVMEWWKLVCEELDNEFVTWIFKKNTRAISFLLKNGMEIVDNDPKKDFFNLTYVVCQQEA